MSDSGLLLLVLDIADVEHKADHTSSFTSAQGLPGDTVPECFFTVPIQAHAQQQRRTVVLQGVQSGSQFFSVGRVDRHQKNRQ
ncbi:hypothetical protein D9M71_190390 [compost metagenome]